MSRRSTHELATKRPERHAVHDDPQRANGGGWANGNVIFIPTVGAIADFWSPAAFSSPTNPRTTVRTAAKSTRSATSTVREVSDGHQHETRKRRYGCLPHPSPASAAGTARCQYRQCSDRFLSGWSVSTPGDTPSVSSVVSIPLAATAGTRRYRPVSNPTDRAHRSAS